MKNYVESDKYPRSEFRGQIVNNSAVDYSKDGVYEVKVKGKLTIHGVTREIEKRWKDHDKRRQAACCLHAGDKPVGL